MEDKSATLVSARRGPGRPPKNRIAARTGIIAGIVTAPSEPNYVVEMVYDNPTIFKNIISIYKKHSVNEICFEFGPNGLHCVCSDYHDHMVIEMNIFAAKMTKYYCKEPLTACFKYDDVATFFKKTIAESNYFSIFMTEEDKRSKMHINVREAKLGSNTTIPIDLRTKTKNADPPFNINELNLDNYPVSFKMPSSSLKTLIKTVSGQINTCIQLRHGEFLQFSRDANNNGPSSTFEPSKIYLVDKLARDDILIANFETSSVRPFIDVQFSKDITVYVDNFNPIVLSSTDSENRYVVRIFVTLTKHV